MTEIRRYRFHTDVELGWEYGQHTDGEFVKWEDVQDLLARVGHWQPIETAPPNTDLLVVYETRVGALVTIAAFIDGRWCSEHGRVTPMHWMPLPAPPEATLKAQP